MSPVHTVLKPLRMAQWYVSRLGTGSSTPTVLFRLSASGGFELVFTPFRGAVNATIVDFSWWRSPWETRYSLSASSAFASNLAATQVLWPRPPPTDARNPALPLPSCAASPGTTGAPASPLHRTSARWRRVRDHPRGRSVPQRARGGALRVARERTSRTRSAPLTARWRPAPPRFRNPTPCPPPLLPPPAQLRGSPAPGSLPGPPGSCRHRRAAPGATCSDRGSSWPELRSAPASG